MALPPSNRRPQERTQTLARATANTAQYVDVQGAGSAFSAMAASIKGLSAQHTAEQEAIERIKDQEALDAQYMAIVENPDLIREASRTGDYSQLPAAARMNRPRVRANLEKTNAAAYLPTLLKEASEELLALPPDQDPGAHIEGFIARKTEGLSDTMRRSLHGSVMSGTAKMVAAQKQLRSSLHNDKQLDNLRNGLEGLLSTGPAPSMADVEDLAKTVTGSMQGEAARNLGRIQSLVAETLVRQQAAGGAAGARAAALAEQDSSLYSGGSINSAYDSTERRKWRDQGARAEADFLTKEQKDNMGALVSKFQTDPSNAGKHWREYNAGFTGNRNGSAYLKLQSSYLSIQANATESERFVAGRTSVISKGGADAGIKSALMRLGASDTPSSKDLATVAILARAGGMSETNQLMINQLMETPGKARVMLGLVNDLRKLKDGAGRNYRPSDVLGENTQALAILALMSKADISTDEKLEAVHLDAVARTKKMGSDRQALTKWVNKNGRRNSQYGKNPLDWFIDKHGEALAKSMGISYELIKVPRNRSAATTEYLQTTLNLAINLNTQEALDAQGLIDRAGLLAGHRVFIDIQGQSHVQTGLGIGTDSQNNLTQLQDRGISKTLADDIVGNQRLAGAAPGTSRVVDSEGRTIVIPTESPSIISEDMASTLVDSGKFAKVETLEALRATPRSILEIDGQIYFNPPKHTEVGTKILLDSSGAIYLESTEDGWIQVVDHARAPTHSSQTSLVQQALAAVLTFEPDAVEKTEAGAALYSRLKERRNAVTLDDEDLVDAITVRLYERQEGPGIAPSTDAYDRLASGTLTVEDISKLPPDLQYEYRRRLMEGGENAKGPLAAEDMTEEVMRGIAGVVAPGTEIPKVPEDTPTTTTPDTGDSNDTRAVRAEVGREEVSKSIASGDAHPSALGLTKELPAPEALKASAVENNFIPNPEQLALSTQETIVGSYPTQSWQPVKPGTIGKHSLSQRMNPLKIMGTDRLGVPTPESYKGHNEGLQAGLDRFTQRVNQGATTIQDVFGAPTPLERALQAKVQQESGKVLIAERGYSTTSNSSIRKIFGSRVSKFSDKELADLKSDPKAFFDHVYRSIGGYDYRGRGHIQLTGRPNYEAASKAIFGDDRLAKDPDMALKPEVNAAIVEWYMGQALPVMSKRMNIPLTKDIGQEDANKLVFGAIAGRPVDVNTGGHLGRLYREHSKLVSKGERANPELPLSSMRTIARHLGLDSVDSPANFKDPAVMAKFMRGIAESNLGAEEAALWAPYIEGVVSGEPLDRPQSGTGDAVLGNGYRMDWPTSQDEMVASGVRDVQAVTTESSEALVAHRIEYMMSNMSSWFDGAELSNDQRSALMQYIYSSKWNDETGRPSVLSPKLIRAVKTGNHETVAKIIRRDTRIYAQGLNKHQRELRRHTLATDRTSISIRYLNGAQ